MPLSSAAAKVIPAEGQNAFWESTDAYNAWMDAWLWVTSGLKFHCFHSRARHAISEKIHSTGHIEMLLQLRNEIGTQPSPVRRGSQSGSDSVPEASVSSSAAQPRFGLREHDRGLAARPGAQPGQRWHCEGTPPQ